MGFARLSLELLARDAATVQGVEFVTDRAPRRAPRLAIGLVTHDREMFLERTLAALAEAAEGQPQIRRVIVVNQGRAFRREGVKRRFADPLFLEVEQANLGGCGGFARAMLEADRHGDEMTHLLLMDDDILLDPRLLHRALAFAAHARRDVVIGGQAIELERRTVLQEASGHLGAHWLPVIRGAEMDLTSGAAWALWDEGAQPDYNGWWFTLFPLAAIRECGLPLPFFLHYDDIEYGLRLRAAGYPLVPLPGLGVWHASVRFKHLGQMQYYDLRNGLITAAAHPERAPVPPAIHVLGWMLHHLLLHRYRAASASLLAIRDFLDGPQVLLGSNGRDLHHRLLAHLAPSPAPHFAEQRPTGGAERPPAFYAATSPPLGYGEAVRQCLAVMLPGAGRGPSVLQIGAPDPRFIRGRPYFLALDPAGERCLVMRPRRRRFAVLLARSLLLSLRYAIFARSAARRWRGAVPDLRAAARWQAEFGLARD